MKQLWKKVRNIAEMIFLSLHTTVICLIVLCILVLWGTLYQTSHGIYEAKQYLFDAWWVVVGGFIPIPAVRLTILFLILNQLGILAFKQSWKPAKAGIILAHLGVLILFMGGAYISYTSRESTLSLWEGERSSESYNFQKWELAAWKQDSAGIILSSSSTVDFDTIHQGLKLLFPSCEIPFSVETMYRNCIAYAPPYYDKSANRGLIEIDSIAARPPESDPSKNIPGVNLFCVVDGARQQQLLFGGNTEPSRFKIGHTEVFLALRPKPIPLPVTITLLDFIKDDYAGTSTARQYSSKIHVKAEDIDRDVVVSMNRPFRYRHHTFYQSSFSSSDNRESSTFAVVENRGKALPYIAGLLIGIGLIFHFCLKLIFYLSRVRKVVS